MNIIHELNSMEIQSVAENGERICHVLIILDLLYKILYPNDLKINLIEILLMLTLRPDWSKSKYPDDLTSVLNFILPNYRKHIVFVLAWFINQIVITKNLDWVYVMPLMHALDGKLDKCTDSDEIQWTDDYIQSWNMGKAKPQAFFK